MSDLRERISNLNFYLSSWLDLSHGLHSYIVDPIRSQLAFIDPDSASQGALLLGYLKLYEKTAVQEYLDSALKCGEWLVANYIWEANIFYNSCFEHKPGNDENYASLFGNAYATLALTRLCSVLKKQNMNYNRFFNVAKNNIERFIIAKCWDYKRSFLEFSHNSQLFNLPAAATTIRAIMRYSLLVDEPSMITDYCIPTAIQLLKFQYKDGCFAMDEKDEISPLFRCAFTIKGLAEMCEVRQDEKVVERLKDAVSFLNKSVHPTEKLYYYGYRGNTFLKYPLYVAHSAVIASTIKQLAPLGINSNVADSVIESVLSRQYSNGALPSYIGFCNVLSEICEKPKQPLWQDVLPCPAWNAFAFESLANLLPIKAELPLTNADFPCTYESKDYSITERNSTVIFFAKDGSIAAKWFKGHSNWLFGKLYITATEEKKKSSKKMLKKSEATTKKKAKVSKKAAKVEVKANVAKLVEQKQKELQPTQPTQEPEKPAQTQPVIQTEKPKRFLFGLFRR
ncbi:MAG: hypothetical protein N3F05_01340 [Candidatus Diapherotrites archaeon]|nr:hypothetical protein [Candidatus Diapherotrites archaeon]